MAIQVSCTVWNAKCDKNTVGSGSRVEVRFLCCAYFRLTFMFLIDFLINFLINFLIDFFYQFSERFSDQFSEQFSDRFSEWFSDQFFATRFSDRSAARFLEQTMKLSFTMHAQLQHMKWRRKWKHKFFYCPGRKASWSNSVFVFFQPCTNISGRKQWFWVRFKETRYRLCYKLKLHHENYRLGILFYGLQASNVTNESAVLATHHR